MTTKEILITEILQVCKISNMTNAERLPKYRKRNVDMQSAFLALAFCNELQLMHIAAELNIKIPEKRKS